MTSPDVVPNYRVATYYGFGALALVVAAALAAPWGLVLLWPAVSCGIVAAGYFGVGPRIYGKRGGRLSRGARVLMAPVLLGQQLSLKHYRRHARPWDPVVPEVIIGRVLDEDEAQALIDTGVAAVLDLTAEFSEAEILRTTAYLNLRILDLTAPTATQLHAAIDFIRAHAELGPVYVHCKVGYSRTAAVVGAYLIAAGHAAGAREAIASMRAARPGIVIRPEVVIALEAFEARHRAIAAN